MGALADASQSDVRRTPASAAFRNPSRAALVRLVDSDSADQGFTVDQPVRRVNANTEPLRPTPLAMWASARICRERVVSY